MFDELKEYKIIEWGKLLLVIGLVVLIGLFIVNQYVAFRYKAVFLSTPCELCLELNDNVKLCPTDTRFYNKVIIETEQINYTKILNDLVFPEEYE